MKYFGTDGIRGPVGSAWVNQEFYFQLGLAVARLLKATAPSDQISFVVGRDTRKSGDGLKDALAAGLSQEGVAVIDLGVVPTPAVSQLIPVQAASFGASITASHNPATDNGIKFFDDQGLKLTLEFEQAFEEEITKVLEQQITRNNDSVKIEQVDGLALYVEHAKQKFPAAFLAGKKIVLDTANGATAKSSEQVFAYYGAELVRLGDQPDGENINEACGSEHPEKLAEAVNAHQADFGVGHDGDGDRVIICNSQGDLFDGDRMLALLALWSQKKAQVPEAVSTIQSNAGLDAFLTQEGLLLHRTDVGDRNVLHKLLERKALVGGENSGHYILRSFSNCGDGLYAGLALLSFLIETNTTLADWTEKIFLYPQATSALQVREKTPLEELPAFQKVKAEIESELAGEGRILVRYSGTEPKVRLLVECPDPEKSKQYLKRLEAVFQ